MSDTLPVINIETGDHPTYVVIWMHGLGADGHDFVPIIKELKLPIGISIRFIFPHAPMRAVTINRGFVMRAWYDIFEANIEIIEDERGIRNSQLAIDDLIELEIQRGIKPQHIILAGFSQGGVMALHTGLRYTSRLGGIMALSCYLPLSAKLDDEINQNNRLTPIFMAHGDIDTVIPIDMAKLSLEKLLKSGCKVEWHEYAMGHSLCGKEVIDINNWLNRIIGHS